MPEFIIAKQGQHCYNNGIVTQRRFCGSSAEAILGNPFSKRFKACVDKDKAPTDMVVDQWLTQAAMYEAFGGTEYREGGAPDEAAVRAIADRNRLC